MLPFYFTFQQRRIEAEIQFVSCEPEEQKRKHYKKDTYFSDEESLSEWWPDENITFIICVHISIHKSEKIAPPIVVSRCGFLSVWIGRKQIWLVVWVAEYIAKN